MILRPLQMACGALALTFVIACGGGNQPQPAGGPQPGQQTNADQLTAQDVQAIAQTAAASVNLAVSVVISNRQGDILAVYIKPGTPATSIGNFGQAVDTNELAVGLARTAAFFSNDQAPLSSRTVR